MTTPKYAHVDTKQADGFYIQFERVTLPDDDASPDEYLFQDEIYRDEDQARLDAFNAGDWSFIGIRALAKCCVIKHGVGTMFNLESPGLWAIESDSDESHLAETYEAEKQELLALIGEMTNPVIEG